MKHLLRHTKMQLLEELDKIEEARVTGARKDNTKLEFIYEDLVSRIDDALDEVDESPPTGARFDRQRQAGPRRNISANQIANIYKRPRAGFEDSSFFDDLGWDNLRDKVTPDRRDDHHAMRDGSKESFDDLRENVESITGGFNPDRLRKLADIAEEVEEKNLDPREMSEDEFQKLLARLRPDLVNWATGKESFVEDRFDKPEIANTIREALQEAKEESDGTVDMLRTFHERISDSLFDTSRNLDDDYDPDYEDLNSHKDMRDSGRPESDSESEVNEPVLKTVLTAARETTDAHTFDSLVDILGDVTGRSENELRESIEKHKRRT